MVALRFAKKNSLLAVDFQNLMIENIDKVADKLYIALRDIEKEKLRVARAYKKCEGEKLPSWRPSVEGNLTSWFERQKNWQVVSKLGGPFQGCE
jgi:hypothetical protein